MNTSDSQNSDFPDGLPKPLSSNVKKLLFFGITGFVAVLLGFLLFSGGSKPKRAPMSAARSAPADTQEYERTMPGPVPVDFKPKLDPSNNPLREALNREEPPKLERLGENDPSRSNTPTFNEDPNTGIHNSGMSAPIAPPQPYQLSGKMQKRLNESYQAMVTHFKGRQSWSLSEENIARASSNALASVDGSLQHLIENPGITVSGMLYTVPSGTRLIAVSDSKVSSDHPGFFTATVVMPYALKGTKVICQSGVNVKNRIPIQPVKLILTDSSEQVLTGQVQTDFPGFDGDVTTHYMARLAPAITNAAIGGAFAAWALSRSQSGTNIDTRDAIVAPVVQSSVEGLQNEITRMGGDYPNTVEVPAGKQFTILITDHFSFRR